MNDFQIFLILSALGVALVLLYRRRSVIVQEYQIGILRRNGRFERLLATGRHWMLWPGIEIHLVDRRPSLLVVSGQEIPTKDRASVKVSVVLRYRIRDAQRWLEGSADAQTDLHSTLQIALRAAFVKVELETLLTDHAPVDAALEQALASLAPRLGLEIEAVRLRDVTLSGELKRAMAEETRARAEGRAKLERARAETAALRNLINAARLVRENVGLYELRLLETATLAAERPGTSLHLELAKAIAERQSP